MRQVVVRDDLTLTCQGTAKHKWAIVIEKARRNGDIVHSVRPFFLKSEAERNIPNEKSRHKNVNSIFILPLQSVPVDQEDKPEAVPTKKTIQEAPSTPSVNITQTKLFKNPNQNTKNDNQAAQPVQFKRRKPNKSPAVDLGSAPQPLEYHPASPARNQPIAPTKIAEVAEPSQQIQRQMDMIIGELRAEKPKGTLNNNPRLQFRSYALWSVFVNRSPRNFPRGKYVFKEDWTPPFDEFVKHNGVYVWWYTKQALNMRLHPSFRLVYAAGNRAHLVIVHTSIMKRAEGVGLHPIEINNAEWGRAYTIKGASAASIASFTRIGEITEGPVVEYEDSEFPLGARGS
jgi:hypothetical protein